MMKQRPPTLSADAHPDPARNDKAIVPDFDPAATLAGIRAEAGSWRDLDTEALKTEIYRAHEEETQPLDRE